MLIWIVVEVSVSLLMSKYIFFGWSLNLLNFYEIGINFNSCSTSQKTLKQILLNIH